LCSRPELDEVNFWQPHGDRAFRALLPGDPFFFKLRAPQKSIAGFGFFQRYESMTARYAWDCFADANGAPTFAAMLDRLARLRKEPTPSTGEFKIGCIMIAAPVFFVPDEWVRPPAAWAERGIQPGKVYDLSAGEANRILRECMEPATGGVHIWHVDADPQLVAENFARYGAAVEVRPRLGQGLFSLAVRDAYHGACAVTREHSLPALEAAHILPYGLGGEHSRGHGLLLRSDCTAVRPCYVTVTPTMSSGSAGGLREDFITANSYYSLDGARSPCPTGTRGAPTGNCSNGTSERYFGRRA
jgi:putative restriction endonuclease